MTAAAAGPDAGDGALLDLCRAALEGAQGDEAVEAFAVHEVETSVRAFDRSVEKATSAEARGVGLRVVRDGRLGFAATSDVSPEGLRWALAAARENAALGDPDQGNVLPQPEPVQPLQGIALPGLEAVPPDEKVRVALELERLATSRDPRVSRVHGASYGDARTRVAVASTTGVAAEYARTDCYLSVSVLAEDGDETQTGFGVSMGRRFDELDLERCASDAVLRATRLLGGRKPATRSVPVVFDPLVTATFLSVVASGFSAEAVQKGRSLFADRLGDVIADDGLAIVDDGRLLDGPAAAPFDDEGVPTRRTEVVSGGVLRTFLHSTETAARAGDGQRSTGSAARSGFGSSPGVGTTNLFLDGRTTPVADLLRSAGGGLYVQEAKGVHSGVNPVSGEFSVGVVGLWIEPDGSLGAPVREATVSSTIVEMLRSVSALGDDRQFLAGSTAGTTLLLGPMTVAGE